MKFVIGRTLTILSWDNPVTAFFRINRKLCHSLGRPSRSDFVQFEFVELTKYLKKLLTPTLRNSLEYTYREEGKANDDSK